MDEQKMTNPSEATGAAIEEERPLAPDEEIAEIEKLLATDGEDFQARCRLGELYFSKGRLDDALSEVKKSIEMAEGLRTEMNRSLAMYYSNLGHDLRDQRHDGRGRSANLKKRWRCMPEDVLALFNLGRVHSDKRQFVEAKNYYERLVESRQDDPMAWYNLAGVYAELDNPAGLRLQHHGHGHSVLLTSA